VTTVPFPAALRQWLRIGVLGFGGPSGQIALMHRDLVERKGWIDEDRFLHALNYCMLLPGPEAQQLAIYVGWLLHGTRGGVAAGALFVLPGALFMLLLSWLYAAHGHLAWVAALFYGLKPAVIAIVLHAVGRIGRRALRRRWLYGVSAVSFVAIFVYDVPFPLIVLGAGVLGFAAAHVAPALFPALDGAARLPARRGSFFTSPPAATPPHPGEAASVPPAPARRFSPLHHLARQVAIWIPVWAAPVILFSAALGPDHVLVRLGTFFARAAMATFGGAYAVLAYIAQAAVMQHGWLASSEMLDGLGLAETTPGPLILVTQFVGYLAGWHDPAPFGPALAGLLGAAVVTWVTFVPCFLWIFLGAPFIEGLRGQTRLSGALTAITAAVVGVILNLSVWFAILSLFARVDSVRVPGGHLLVPHPASLDIFGLCLAVAALLALRRWPNGLVPVLGAAALAGMIWRLA
jgi:chromate transporter